MGRITFTADAQHEDIVESVQSEDGVESQAEAVRECITRDAALQQRVAALQQDLEDAEARQDALRRQLQAANSRDEDHQELVEYVQDERRLQRQREERERMKETAGVLTRAKWWVTGMPDPESADDK
jgi:flagellar biosynthesis chaperone FliJ